MWFQSNEDNVVNLENGHHFRVQEVEDSHLIFHKTWEVRSTHPTAGVITLYSYDTQEEARESLVSVLKAFDIKAVEIKEPKQAEDTKTKGPKK